MFRGEDLAVRGGVRLLATSLQVGSHFRLKTYVFEIIEVVANEDDGPGRNFKLRLLCKDESKGPVTAVASMDGYLVSSMGQKVGMRL